MKTITIGRGDGANIIIDNEMISRRHAILKISTFGRMEIVDMGKNGTFVNGIRLRPNVPFPVTRKDIVKFADQDSPFKLDWSQVPDNSIIYKIAIAAIVGLFAIILLVIFIRSCSNDEKNSQTAPTKIEVAPAQESSSAAPVSSSIESNKKEGVSEGSPENGDKEMENKTKKKEEKDLEGKTIQQLFPQRQVKKDANPDSKKNGKESIKPSNVKSKKNNKNNEHGSDNKTVII